jgi:hypothetical protein
MYPIAKSALPCADIRLKNNSFNKHFKKPEQINSGFVEY